LVLRRDLGYINRKHPASRLCIGSRSELDHEAFLVTMAETRTVTSGVDTHADVNLAAGLDQIGGLLGV